MTMTGMLNNKTIQNVMNKLVAQQEKGLKKYGTLVDPSKLELEEWVVHAQEEALDLAIYLECLLEHLKNKE